jgi:hypothetical protein
MKRRRRRRRISYQTIIDYLPEATMHLGSDLAVPGLACN